MCCDVSDKLKCVHLIWEAFVSFGGSVVNGAAINSAVNSAEKKAPGKGNVVTQFALAWSRLSFILCQSFSVLVFTLSLLLIFPALANSAEFATLDEFKALGERFDHLTTGYALTGEHGQLDCGECHIGGVFEALPRECEACHDNVIATGMPSMHVETSAPCDTCHTTSGFISTAVMDHSIVTGACSSCHDGISATGKSALHVATTNLCEACHTTNIWAPVRFFDHEHSIGSCVTCHNNTIEEGKPANHLPTTDACEACHSYSRVPEWDSEGAAVDHAEVSGRCSACHDCAVLPNSCKPPSPPHPVTNEECNACHTPGVPFADAQSPPPSTSLNLNWIQGGEGSHSEVPPGSCSSCHNDVIERGKHSGHCPTSQECDSCHSSLIQWKSANKGC